MPRLVYNFEHKSQTKMFDCWYACIQMLLSYRAGHKAKPQGAAIARHRDRRALGRKLGFGSDVGLQVMRDNGLLGVGSRLNSKDIMSVHRLLSASGPFIVGGGFGPCGMGHFVVICGVDTDAGLVWRDNPAWNYEKAWKPLSYLDKVWANKDGVIDDEAVVALLPLNR